MRKRFWPHSETMVLAVALWLCALPVIAILVIPFFGLKVGGVLALVLFLVLLVMCWSLCGRQAWQVRQKR
ncbi:MAG: hypothetical protein R6X32_21435 [Chloroflexota bacterium]|jgi:hypothetical protein